MAQGVRVDGLRQTIRSLERLGVSVQDLKAAFQQVGQIVRGEAVSLTPTLSGALAASIRASKAKNKAEIRAGNARTVYAGVIHYGGYNNIEPHPFLTQAASNKRQEVVSTIENDLQDLINQLGLD